MSRAGTSARIGETFRIRVSPRDIMAAIDVCKNTKAFMPGMSLAQVISYAFRISMEALRLSRDVPTRDGFEYTDMLSEFPDRRTVDSGRARSLLITDTIEQAVASGNVPVAIRHDRRIAGQARYEELHTKAMHASDSMTGEEWEEHSKLQLEFGP